MTADQSGQQGIKMPLLVGIICTLLILGLNLTQNLILGGFDDEITELIEANINPNVVQGDDDHSDMAGPMIVEEEDGHGGQQAGPFEDETGGEGGHDEETMVLIVPESPD